MANNEEYWFWRWLDEYGVTTPSEAEVVLRDEHAIDRISELSGENRPLTDAANGEVIVAGWGLGRGLWRSHAVHVATKRADDLLRQTWHYYDAVILEDAIRHEVVHHWTDPLKRRRERLLGHISVILHLRNLGADHLIRFRDKPKICATNWRKHIEEDRLPALLTGADKLILQIASEAKVGIANRTGFRDLVVRDTRLPGGHMHRRFSSHDPRQLQVKAAVEEALRGHIAYLRADLLTARRYNAPIGVADERAAEILSGSGIGSPLFNLELPVLTGIPTATLIEIRNDAGDVFQGFQTALRLAATKVAKDNPEASAIKIAREIQADIIDPEILRISKVLEGAKKTLALHSSVGVVFGIVAAGVGLLLHSPTVVNVGLSVGGTGLTAASAKFFDTKDNIKRSDMYFLWKASRKSER